jgi:hypothetical protein
MHVHAWRAQSAAFDWLCSPKPIETKRACVLIVYRRSLRPANLVDLRCDQVFLFTTAGFARMIESSGAEARLGCARMNTRVPYRATIPGGWPPSNGGWSGRLSNRVALLHPPHPPLPFGTPFGVERW